jgi:KDO2-lipid IV(A) lauroyltransferase
MFNKYLIEFKLLLFIGKIFTWVGFKHIKITAKFLSFFSFRILRIRRKTVIRNLSLAFPELSKNQVKKIAYENYLSVAITFLEIFGVSKIDKQTIIDLFTVNDFDFIKRKVDENKGLIFLTAHLGNWELGAIAAGLYFNQGINVLVKKQKNLFVAEWLSGIRQKFGNRQVFLGVSVRELYSAIKNKKVVGVVGDQRGTKDGVVVNFFGRPTYTFPGTASIALKTNCTVLVFICVRNKNGKYDSICEEIVVQVLKGTKEEKIQEFNQKYMSILEKTIRKYPDQWLWMHNIWKY